MVRIPLIALVFVCASLQAADVYVWVYESGRRQISDVVPEKDRARAKKVEIPSPSSEEPAREARSAAAGGSAAPVEQPVARPRTTMDCQASWRVYRESYLEASECVAFYEYALRGLAVDPRAECPVVLARPRDCPSPGR